MLSGAVETILFPFSVFAFPRWSLFACMFSVSWAPFFDLSLYLSMLLSRLFVVRGFVVCVVDVVAKDNGHGEILRSKEMFVLMWMWRR